MFFELFSFLKELFCFTGSYSNDCFLEPLSDEDEEKYILLKMEGDKDARNKLIEHNLRLVAHITKKYDTKYVSNDDLISIGTIGLIKGVDTFSNTKGVKLTTYCARCIENEILMFFRSNNKYSKDVSMNDAIGYDKDGNEYANADDYITFTISKTNGTVLANSDKDTFGIYVTTKGNLKDDDYILFHVEAISRGPYIETLKGDFKVGITNLGMSYEINDNPNDPYLQLSVTNTRNYYFTKEAFGGYGAAVKIPVEEYLSLSDENKLDKVTKNGQQKCINQICKTLEVTKEELILFSSVTKTGKQEVYSKIIENLELK